MENVIFVTKNHYYNDMTTIEIIGTIVTTAIAVGGSIWAVLAKIFKLGKVMQHLDEFENRVTSDLAAIQNRLDKLPCAYHHDDITKMKSILIQKYPTSATIFSIKMSPRKLNDLGAKLYADINGGKFIAKNKSALFEFITNSAPRVPLDVEQAALLACTSMVNTPAFNDMKNYIYNAATIELPDGYKYDVSISDVCFVLSIPLRDMYLEAHPEINTKDNDNK
jgi:hypothetical protein